MIGNKKLQERQILRVICQGCSDGPLETPDRKRLASYDWTEPEHEAVFHALEGLAAARPETVRQQLPARLTRLGFPDIAWEDLFQPHGLSRGEAGHLIAEILGGEAGRPSSR